jgi:metal-responsive CopG/Arc/MetJ family transcriptional regulator
MITSKDLNVVISTRITEQEYALIEKLIKGRKRKRSALIRYLIQKGLLEVERLHTRLNKNG